MVQRSMNVKIALFRHERFSLITFEVFTLENFFWYHHVSLVKTNRNIAVKVKEVEVLTEKVMLHISRCVLLRLTHWKHFHVSSHSNQKLLVKMVFDLRRPYVTFHKMSGQKNSQVITISQNTSILKELDHSTRFLETMNI